MADSSYTELLQPVLAGGVHRTNFFNGRVLTADDLSTEQSAARDEHAGLGRAVGEGVVWGYEIVPGEELPQSGAAPVTVLAIAPGFALNRRGEPVALGARTQLHLVRSPSAVAPASDFASCTAGVTTLTNPGLYILTVAPTTGYDGSAQVVGLDEDGIASPCTSGYAVEAVCFALTPVDFAGATGLAAEAAGMTTAIQALEQGSVTADASRFRSCIAHYFLDSDDGAWAANPFPAATGGADVPHYPVSQLVPDPLEQLYRDNLLDPAAVPLALLYWSRQGVQFVDWWAVRRPLHALPAAAAWAPLTGGRDAALGLARFLQFQQQLEWLPAALKQTSPATVLFRYLPPLGLLSPTDFPGGGAAFLAGLHTGAPTPIPGAQLEPLLRDALSAGPLDLTGAAASDRVQRYRVGTAPGYEVFAARALRRTTEVDSAARAFADTLKAYQHLSTAFQALLQPTSLPTGGVAGGGVITDTLRPILLALFAISGVSQVAVGCQALAIGGQLDHDRAVQALLGLIDCQNSMAQALKQEFTDTRLNTAAYEILALVQSLKSSLDQSDLASSASTQQSINQKVETLAVALPTMLLATGTVTGITNGSRDLLRGIPVKIVGLPLSAVSDSAGRYTLENVPAGYQMVEATAGGTNPIRKTVYVPAGGSVTADFYL